MDYGYMSQKLGAARSCLRLLHPRENEQSVTTAMLECMIALDGINDERPDGLEPHLSRLVDPLDTSELSDPSCIGLHTVKARMYTDDQLRQFSCTVDELATLCASRR